MRILFLIPNLEYSAATQQLRLLLGGLPRPRFEPHVCVLRNGGPEMEELARLGVPTETLGGTRRLDPRPLARLRQRVRALDPQVIHCWGQKALRLLVALPQSGRAFLGSRLLGAPAPGRIDRWLWRRLDRIIVSGPAEARACRAAGVREAHTVLIPPAVESRCGGGKAEEENVGSALPAGARLILCVGRLEAGKGYRDAVWAFDILRYVYADLHLVFVGDGPERPRLERFAHAIGAARQVHFLGARPDLGCWMERAEVVWVPTRDHGGVHVALEAMSAGRPVVAGQRPQLAEVIADGATGLLVPPGDKVALARQTRGLLDDGPRRQRMGAAARQRAEQEFAPSALVRRYAELYLSCKT